jgi:hypothetical protein
MTRPVNTDPFAHLVDLDVIDIDAIAADLAHLRVIGVRLAELVAVRTAGGQGPHITTFAGRAEVLALAELVEQLAAVTYRRIFEEELPELDRRPA